jgi:iron complex transport system ATP-binding protein
MSVVLTERVTPDMMTARDIVSTGRYPHTNHFGKLEDKDMKIIQEAVDIVHGQDLMDKEFKSLSDGEKQRIMLARAICQESDIMVLDEPTSFLDIRYKIELLDILSKLSIEKKKTIIMSLHEIDLVPKIADKVILIKDGVIFDYGPPEEVITDDSIKEVYNLDIGSFNTIAGNVELPKAGNLAKVFVLGGGGKGTKIYRALNKASIGFYSGILFKNDIDYNVSNSLAIESVAENSFTEIRKEKLEDAKSLIKECDFLIDSGVDLVGINSGNRSIIIKR